MRDWRGLYLVAVLLWCYGHVAAAEDETSLAAAGNCIKQICDVQYTEGCESPQFLDIYLPADSGSLRPVVVFIHGGYWSQGDKADHPELFVPLVEAGCVVFSINYRLTDVAPYPAQLDDCKAAVRWARAHARQYCGDPRRIAASGYSAGAHLAALLGTTAGVAGLEGDRGTPGVSSRVQAVVDWYGPADLTLADAAEGRDISPVIRLLGGSPAEQPELAQLASATTFISADDPPFLIIHGTEDPIVPFAVSQYFAALLAGADIGVELVAVPGGQHGGFEGCQPGLDELMQRVAEFLGASLALD